ncbi:MAG: pilus assembly protein PilM [Patescibacteria group bacterium]|nr:pilus assembly protein PilM [Patescibacteria group bacterium]
MKNIYFGLDFGHYEIKLSVLEEDPLGKLISYNHSIRNENLREGEILDQDALFHSLENLFSNILNSFNIAKIDNLIISFNFPHFQNYFQKGHSIFEGNVQEEDLERAIKTARTSLLINNQEILVEEPIKFILDGNQEIRDPLGFTGRRLDVEVFFITCHKSILDKFRNVFKRLEINKINFIPSFYAASKVCLSKKDKEIGVGLIDFGSENTTISFFQYGKLINYKSYKFGGEKLTEDLAINLKIDIEEAEKLKIAFFNNQLAKEGKKKLKIKKFIEKKIKEYFEKNNLRSYLKEIKNNYRLPAGIIVIGSFAKIIHLDNLIKNFFDFQLKLSKDDLGLFEKQDDLLKYSASVGCALIAKELDYKNENWLQKIKNFFRFSN